MAERTVFQSLSQRHVVSLGPQASVWEAACVMTRVLAKALNPQTTLTSEVMTPNPHCVEPHTKVSEAVLIMIERGFRHLPIITPANKILGVFSVRDALPREIGDAVSLAEFNDQVNDALG